MTKCPACLTAFPKGDWAALAQHLAERAQRSDAVHVRWLNQNISRKRIPLDDLESRIHQFFDLGARPLSAWIRSRFISKFYGEPPHPFPAALQHPSRATLLGYVFEHQHFLRQWVRSCAYIMARTDQAEVARYELDNLNTEFGGFGTPTPSHYELLLQMGESLGVSRAQILNTPPLASTAAAIQEWNRIATEEHWVEAVAGMHSLELIANRNLVDEGASISYFDPRILNGTEVNAPAKAFLREGYEADAGHSDEALALVDRFAVELDRVEEVQATFLRSADLFDDYLIARLERAAQFES
ncbi:MAG: iron-containing redox enzyme family protein [Thermoplasmata archaeon]|nr:iron-containing redox enzyme family protein [Thermoplasmata archaeon]